MKKIIILDDDRFWATNYIDGLSRHFHGRYEVQPFYEVDDFFEFMQRSGRAEGDIAAVVLDVMMPGPSGVDPAETASGYETGIYVLRQVRDQTVRQSIAVFLLSNTRLDNLVEAIDAVGVPGHLLDHSQKLDCNSRQLPAIIDARIAVAQRPLPSPPPPPSEQTVTSAGPECRCASFRNDVQQPPRPVDDSSKVPSGRMKKGVSWRQISGQRRRTMFSGAWGTDPRTAPISACSANATLGDGGDGGDGGGIERWRAVGPRPAKERWGHVPPRRGFGKVRRGGVRRGHVPPGGLGSAGPRPAAGGIGGATSRRGGIGGATSRRGSGSPVFAVAAGKPCIRFGFR